MSQWTNHVIPISDVVVGFHVIGYLADDTDHMHQHEEIYNAKSTEVEFNNVLLMTMKTKTPSRIRHKVRHVDSGHALQHYVIQEIQSQIQNFFEDLIYLKTY
ncbi:hypothetical protein EVAR_50398_1 [Eumeta japonica]|uniref:Uncharacterized protein n=1 Tax=Eumeta variegata TaxID=151549 RepID=A0A4C1WY09_EUMVA|nr:hypothetical protein EVAR_50398_1 [Eumeta japonica]